MIIRFLNRKKIKNNNDTYELVLLSEHFREKSDFKLAAEAAEKAILQEKNNYRAWDAAAVAYRHLGCYEKSMEYFKKAIKISQEDNFIIFPFTSQSSFIYQVKNNLANLYHDKREYRSAIDLHNENLEREKETIKEIENFINQYFSSALNLDQMIHIKSRISKINIAMSYRNIARNFSNLHLYEQSIQYFEESLKYEYRENIIKELEELKRLFK